eukprot:684216-Rhodomonas_salina.1
MWHHFSHKHTHKCLGVVVIVGVGWARCRCSRLEKIDISGCTQLGDAVLKVIAARIEGLRDLNVSFLDVSSRFRSE